MQLAHAWDDGFFALCVKMHSERRIFPGETVNAFGEFIQIILARGKIIPKTEELKYAAQAFILPAGELKVTLTLLDGLMAMEMTGSGTWIDSCGMKW